MLIPSTTYFIDDSQLDYRHSSSFSASVQPNQSCFTKTQLKNYITIATNYFMIIIAAN